MKVRIGISLLFLVIFTCSLSWAENTTGKTAKFQHEPYSEGECTSCHTSSKPSSGDVVAIAPDMCYDCHNEFSGKFAHSPRMAGACLICHNPHESENEFLLNEPVPVLCYLCHEQLEQRMTNEANTTHSPAVDDCLTCHNPHVSDISNKLLTKEMNVLCTQCHIEEDVTTPDFENATHKHEPVERRNGCVLCHDPHATPFEFHLRAEPMDLCFECHNKEVKAYDGKKLANIADLLEKKSNHHGPIKERNCSGCHNPHGSDYFRLLISKYPRGFYAPKFTEDTYKLCFSCHESTILQDKETVTLTNFRNGSKNLHYVHVRHPRKGRTCRACHAIHASTQQKHIRDEVSYGKLGWALELKYEVKFMDKDTGGPCNEKTTNCIKSGGSCQGCHERMSYTFITEEQQK